MRLQAPGEGVGWNSVSSGALCLRSTMPPSNACLLSSARPIGSRPGRLGVGSFASSASVVPHWACRDWDRVQVVGLKRGLRSISALATVWSGQVMSTDACAHLFGASRLPSGLRRVGLWASSAGGVRHWHPSDWDLVGGGSQTLRAFNRWEGSSGRGRGGASDAARTHSRRL